MSIFAISTDYILIKDKDIDKAMQVLISENYYLIQQNV